MHTSPSTRFQSLDVFRGMTICLMIIVNTPGSGASAYAPLHHAHWFGFTPTDLVFPSFLFAVGNALSFSIKKYQAMGNAAVLKKIFKRTVIIFLLGYLMYWFPFFHITSEGHWALNPISQTRIMGVLQRIALAYCFGALIVLYCSRRTAVILSVIFLFGYWALLMIFGEPGAQLSMTGNAVLRLDRFLFGNDHLYHGEGIPFDPEGVLSTIPSIVNVIAGYLAGIFIQQKGKNFECVFKLMMAGTLLVFAALFWNQFFPIGKKIWTSPFVLYTVGIDLLVLPLLIYFIEIRSWKRGVYFFTVVGKNPLSVYLLSELLVVVLYMIPVGGDPLFRWINGHIYQVIVPGAFGSLLFAVSYMLICWLVGYWMDRKKVYIRI
ncbi:DUF5009 domain-containing protein [Compostibacter hankyongensis]|uniref:Acyltransferase family protein n=1 Tax=Compostibacter hankyongensis TaxID=1007089 RepID=A0ABP8FFK4_9BACT